jgi:hypothetical protein
MGTQMKNYYVVLEGKVINVGPWQDKIQQIDEKTNEVILVDNPMPEGAVYGEFDIEYLADGQIVLASDYVELRKAEYPNVTEYLDAIVKNDTDAIKDYINKCKAVKKKYPKPI